MLIEEPERIKELLNKMKIPNPTKERISRLLEYEKYKMSLWLNCIGPALCAAGRLPEPIVMINNLGVLKPFLEKARIIYDEKECGDLIIFHNHYISEESLSYQSCSIHHAAVYLGQHEGEGLVFQKYSLSPFSVESLNSLVERYYHSDRTIYRFW